MFAEQLPEGLAVAELGAVDPQGAATQLSTDVVFELFGWLAVTNTMLAAACVTVVLILAAVLVRLSLNLWPSRAQNAASCLERAGSKSRRPPGAGAHAASCRWSAPRSSSSCSLTNWFGALPLKHVSIVNPAGQSVELFRAATSDLNLTAAIALMVVLVVEGLEVRGLGPLRYLKSLVVPNPMRWLDMLVRPLSLGFRLFGSVFARHVLVSTLLAIAPLVVFPFLVLELFMGLIQAIIFATLTLVFLTIATVHQHSSDAEARSPQPSRAA